MRSDTAVAAAAAAAAARTPTLSNPLGRRRSSRIAAGGTRISIPVVDLHEEAEGDTRGSNVSGDSTNPINVDDIRYPATTREAHKTGDSDHPIAIDDDDLVVTCAIIDPTADHSDLIILDGTDDPKGKSPIRIPPFRRRHTPISGISVVEIGESSGADAHWTEPESYCGVCMESKPLSDCFPFGGCGHTYCAGCVSQYVAAKLGDNVTSIGCIDPGCKDGFLEPQMCRSILRHEVFDGWGRALCEAMIMEQMKFYCPFQDCSALLINDNNCGEVITDCECPHCFRLFCAQCKVPWHAGVTCREYGKLGKDERSQEDLKLWEIAKKSNWQRCPKCKFYVEKVSGCMFVKCRCGYEFCYGCASEMKRDHYCDKCKR